MRGFLCSGLKQNVGGVIQYLILGLHSVVCSSEEQFKLTAI